ncbi:hypothetical protein SAMN04487846_3712 [Microbacterium sp. cf046]|uniref:hypothetical protein n=1 Tax=Microbacterium sp. cf046 TaxID=1761803 RepID=UPI0008F35AA4|nr:hypothetical protein [Microbacterium sp. cf046]SFS18016.1 hypothetical protein SAMN04487846_3712 [Microbacterium sp. cf046]
MQRTADLPLKSTVDEGWKSTASLAVFWVLAVVGLPVMTGAWLLLPLASLEELTEQGKAVAAGTSMAGTTFLYGVLPLVLAHVVGLVLLCSIGGAGRYNRRSGVLLGIAAVAATSIVGLTVTLIISGGQLIATSNYVP